jgi:hypothetical protein
MCRNFTALFAWMLLLSSTTGAQAALIANGDFTTDTDTRLDWMDHSFSVGLSLDQVNAELGAGGLFEGWSVATLDQVHTYLTNAGWIGSFDQTNTSNIGFVSTFEAMTTDSFEFDPLGQLGANRFVDDPAGQFGDLSLVDTQGSGITNYNFSTPVDPSVADPGTSTFLLRATVVPVPAAIWLFGSGILSFFIIPLRKRFAGN